MSSPRPDGSLHLGPASAYFAPRVDQSYARGLWSMGRARRLLRTVGPWNFIKRLVEHPSLPWIRYVGKPATALARRLAGRTTFQLDGQRHPYPRWWVHGERRVELPVALQYLSVQAQEGARRLEVGNVLQTGTAVTRVVVDKYEVGPGIVNADIVEYVPQLPYDVIVAISTLEHVGFDEDQLDLGKFQRAIEHLYTVCLAPGGRMLITLPLGYHPEVDRIVLGDHLGWGKVAVMVHANALGEWQQVSVSALARSGPPMYPYQKHRAAAVAFWTLEKHVASPSSRAA